MKLFILLLLVFATCFTACDSKKAESDTNPGDVTTKSQGKKLDLPYQIERIPDWEKGDDNNIPIAMNVLKCYEVKDFISMKTYLADSVVFIYDNGNFSGSRDQFLKFLKGFRENRTDVKIDMNDYESVKSKNRKEDWVSLWYKEFVADRTGKTDSALVMDDYKIVNGKVAMIDTKFRHLGKN